MGNRIQKILMALLVFCFLMGVSGNLALAAVVDVNTADVKELTKIPGVGKVMAERIVTERTSGGYFKDLQDLQKRVKGIGKKSAEKMKDKVSFSEPAKELSAKGEARKPEAGKN